MTENLQIIKEKIHVACKSVNRKPEEIKIVAVTKYSTVERAKEVLASGIENLGENRDQEFTNKYDSIGTAAIWHFIGSLQTRKVKNVIDKVDYLHSLDRLSLAEEINKRATKPVSCLVQVNVSEEESKHGVKLEDARSFIRQLGDFPNIRIVGLMTMAPNTDDKELIRHCFRSLKVLQVEVQKLTLPFAPCTELSMGMSNDYEIAVEEGATMIRIGTALVGKEL